MRRLPDTESPACWLVEFLLFKFRSYVEFLLLGLVRAMFRSYVEFLRLNEGVVNADRPASLDRLDLEVSG